MFGKGAAEKRGPRDDQWRVHAVRHVTWRQRAACPCSARWPWPAWNHAQRDTGDVLDALLSRGIKIRMERATADDPPAKVTRATEAEGVKAREWLAAWAAQVRDEVADAEPDMPEGHHRPS